jgi:hypothetical protein
MGLSQNAVRAANAKNAGWSWGFPKQGISRARRAVPVAGIGGYSVLKKGS